MFYLRWKTVFWVWQQCYFQRVSAWWLPSLWLPPSPAWLLLGKEGWIRTYAISTVTASTTLALSHPSELHTSCWFPCLPPPSTSSRSQWLSPKEDKIQGESRWPRAVAEGSSNAHLFFCLAIGIYIFLSCSQLSPRVWFSHCYGHHLIVKMLY